MAGPRDSHDSPRMDTDDTLTVREAPRAPTRQEGPDSLSSHIRAAIDHMSAQGPEAESNYRAVVRALAAEPRAVEALAATYRATPEDQYIERWARVNLLSDLRDNNALSVLDHILSTPIPPEKSPDMITYSTVGEEVMIRTTAIEGISRVAESGNRQALELLLKHTQHDNFSVRRAAIQGYLAAAGPDAREELRKRLPERDHFILDIRRADVQDVPQPSIERTPEGKDERDRVPPLPPAGITVRPKIEE
jgi:hypothetical protein